MPPTKLLLSQAGQVSLWRSQSDLGEQFHLETDTTLFSIDPANGRMTGIVAEATLDSPNLLVNTYTFAALMLMMRWHGYYHLHTAAVLSPQQDLHLICGSQRAGKTTLATALGIAGWQTISDDGVLLRQGEQGLPAARAFKRDFHLTRALLEKWPELNNLTARHTYHDRACIDGLELFHTRQLADLSYQQVASVIFPEISGQPQSRLEPLSPSEAIHKLIEQSMFFPLWAEHTQKQITLLTNLVKGASFYRLLAGTDIWNDPHQASLILDALTANSPCHEK